MVARLDGRSFTRLTKRGDLGFAAPFDERFRDLMVRTVAHLMDCGFNVRYGYTQSDEISLLFHPDEAAFGRTLRKYHSILAGEASARFTHELGQPAAFDCRLCQLPRDRDVVDYFRWRQEDAARNALSAHCYWLLRRQGVSASAATARLRGLGEPAKHELLFQHGINFNDLPAWQKRGLGVYHEWYDKPAADPRTGTPVVARRRRLRRDLELPLKDAYEAFILGLLGADP
jgi:tRNA(His) 5'-end guanylyltransferase